MDLTWVLTPGTMSLSEKGGKGFQTQRLREADQAEMTFMKAQAREHPQLPGGDRGKEGVSPRAFRFQASRTTRE